MRLSDIKGEEAFDVLADIIEPVTAIVADPKVKILWDGGKKTDVIKLMLKDHRKETVRILAALDGEDEEGYLEKFNILTLPLALLDLFNDEEFIALFPSAGQTPTSSGSASENTKESKE